MDAQEFSRNYRARLEQWQASRPAEVLRIGVSLAGQVKLRISETGRNAAGQPFPDYVPAYRERRARLGFQVEHVDFTRSGALFRDVNAYLADDNGTRATVVITARRDENQDKLLGAVRKRGNILVPSEEELALAVAAYEDRRRKILGI